MNESLKLEIPFVKSEGLTDYAKSRIGKQLQITEPIDGGDEEVFYNTLEKGDVTLTNEGLETRVKVLYDVEDFPVLLQWKSMISGDYALGIEPSLTRFDDFKPRALAPGEKRQYKIKYAFGRLRAANRQDDEMV